MIDIKIKKNENYFEVFFLITDRDKYSKIRDNYEKKHGKYTIKSVSCPENRISLEETICLPGRNELKDHLSICFDREVIKDVLESFICFKKEIKAEE